MFFGNDFERATQNPRARMWRGPQAHGLRPKIDQAIIFVMRLVVERDVDGHGNL
jgi:hypothetical protein